MSKEIWKLIPNTKNHYASTLGNIKREGYVHKKKLASGVVTEVRTRDRLLIGKKLSKKGYKRININRKVNFVHSLIALTFLGERKKDMQVNHIDGDKLNNSIVNLEYVTNQQNRDHAIKLNLHPNFTNGYCRIKTEDRIKIYKMFHNEKIQQKVIAKQYDICQQHVSKICRDTRILNMIKA